MEGAFSVTFSYLRASELKDVADGLLEHHDDGHLDEEVGETAARMALQRGGEGGTSLSPNINTSKGKGVFGTHLLQPPLPSNADITSRMAVYPAQ